MMVRKRKEVSKVLGCHKFEVTRYDRTILDRILPPLRGRSLKPMSRDERALSRLVANGGTKTTTEAAKKVNL